jgi:arginine/lysine/ornithine decarboxylase
MSHDLSGSEPAYFTPLASALLNLSASKINSFHTLPLSRGRSIQFSGLRDKYAQLFGADYLRSDLTITGEHFDTFFFGKQVIHEAETLAARLFGADGTFFVTSGTTVSNQIALDALYEKGGRVLLDKTCHQSMHFGLHRNHATLDYLQPAWSCGLSDKNMWSPSDLLTMVLEAEREGRPYQLIVLNAHSYDGVVYDVPGLIEFLKENGASTVSFLIDEAWGAANYFQSDLKRLTAMGARRLTARWPDLRIVATQSAHKSMSSLRQASMIHYCGDHTLAARLKVSRFRLHTTSPSYPILASLDLARAQMAVEGTALMARATSLAENFRQEVRRLLGDDAVNTDSFDHEAFQFSHADPTKVSVNTEALAISARDVKEMLFCKHGVYVNRITDSSMLFNFHIGIDADAAQALIVALEEIATHRIAPQLSRSEGFIIPYPPGVPLVVPGQQITAAIQHQIKNIQRNGVQVFYA